MSNKWHPICALDDFRECNEFSDFVVVVDDIDEDGNHGEFTDIAYGINRFPDNVKRFFCVPYDEDFD